MAGPHALRIVDLAAREIRRRIDLDAVYAVTVSADGRLIAAARRELTGEEILKVIPMSRIFVFDAATGGFRRERVCSAIPTDSSSTGITTSTKASLPAW